MRGLWITLGATMLLASILAAWWLELSKPRPVLLVPTLSGQPEYCLTCHSDLHEISPSHPVKVFGCVSCHGGERLALSADLAHSTMRGGANPSDLSVVQQSCGGNQCHSGSPADNNDHIQRVMTSVQSTYAGALANVLYTFGAQSDLTARFGMHAVTDDLVTTSSGVSALQVFDPSQFSSTFVKLFAANCTTCHINAQPAAGSRILEVHRLRSLPFTPNCRREAGQRKEHPRTHHCYSLHAMQHLS